MIEKYYKRIIDNVPSAIIVTDSEFKARLTNTAFKNLFPGGKSRGNIGSVICCSECPKGCGKDPGCEFCNIRGAFEESFYGGKTVSKRAIQRVRSDDAVTEMSFSITVKPLGNGLYMGIIDDALELEISREMQTARSLQQKLLPAGTWAAGKRYAYIYNPCREVGGDLPEVFEVAGSACGMIADVAGKGYSGGMLTAFVKAAYDKKEFSPSKAIENLNEKFKDFTTDERNYITVAAVRIDEASITYSMAGHNVPILLKTEGGITRITLKSFPVCNWFDTPHAYFEDVLPYTKGDILVLLTDGVTECKNVRGEMFGTEGVMKVLSVSKTAQEFIENLEKAISIFCEVQTDDITAIAFDL